MDNSRVFAGFVMMLVGALTMPRHSHASVYSDAVLADNPIHYYRFEEQNTAQPAADQVGAHPGSYTGGVSVGAPSASIALGNAALFDGASGTFVDLAAPFHADPLSVEAWANLSATLSANFAPIVARWNASYELNFNAGSGRANFLTRNGANVFALSESGVIPSEEWHHVVGIFENGLTTIWVDGVQGTTIDTSATSTQLLDGGATLMIGSTVDGTALNWDGLIDEVAFYDYALTGPQVLQHFAAAGIPANVVPEPATCIVWSLLALAFSGDCWWRHRRKA